MPAHAGTMPAGGADAIVGMRFSSGSLQPGTIEMLAYGTAVKFV